MAALLALVSALGWGSSDYAAGVASRRSSAVAVVILTHLVAVGVLVVCAVQVPWPDLTNVTADGGRWSLTWAFRGPGWRGSLAGADLAWGAAAGIAGGLGAMLLYRGLARGAMAVVAPITAATAAAIPAVWGLVQGEPATFVSVAALVIGLCAIVLVSTSGPAPAAGAQLLPPPVAAITDSLERRVAQLEAEVAELRALLMRRRSVRALLANAPPGVPEALASGLGFGAFFVLLDRTSSTAGVWPMIAARGASVAMFAAFALVTAGALLPAAGSRLTVVWAGLFDAGAAVAYLAATHRGYLSVVAVLSSMYPGVTVLLARTLTKERLVRTQLAGLGCAGCAITLFALG